MAELTKDQRERAIELTLGAVQAEADSAAACRAQGPADCTHTSGLIQLWRDGRADRIPPDWRTKYLDACAQVAQQDDPEWQEFVRLRTKFGDRENTHTATHTATRASLRSYPPGVPD